MTEVALRVVGAAGAHRDVLLDAPPGAAIADVAVALAADLGGPVRSLFVGPGRLDPTTPFADAGLGDGDIVGWGRPAPAPGDSAVVLRVTAGPDCGRRFAVTSSALVGRGGRADIDLSDPAVSRCHAVVAPAGEGLHIRDVGGKNGVRVNGRRTMSDIVSVGGEVQVGTTTLRVEGPAPDPVMARWEAPGRLELVAATRPDGSPVGLILDSTCSELVITGDRAAALALARSVVVQLLSASPAGSSLFLLAPREPEAWRWLLWLPHVRAGSPGQPWRVASRPAEVAARLAELEDEIHRRKSVDVEAAPPPIVVILDGVETTPMTDRLRREGAHRGVYTVTVTDRAPAVPADAHVLTVSGDGVRDDKAATTATALGCRVDAADRFARARASVRPDGSQPALTFNRLTAEPDGAGDLGVPVGFDDAGRAMEVDLAAGSVLVERDANRGRATEVLRTLTAIVAATQSPARLRVVVVDTGNELADLELLPHCDWRVTNLDRAVMRAATAAAGECHLVVVVDDVDDIHAADSRLMEALARLAAAPNVSVVLAAAAGVDVPSAVRDSCVTRISIGPGSDPSGPHWLHRDGGAARCWIPVVPPTPAVPGTRSAVPRVTHLAVGALAKRRTVLAHHRGSVAGLAAALSAAAPKPTGPPQEVKPVIRVLLVEDHLVLAEGMRATLELGGCSVVAVSRDTDGALAALSASRIDVAVVDVDLGGADRGMPGADAVDSLRDAVPDLPLVLVGRRGRMSAAVARRVLAQGPQAFLAAGTNGEEVIEAVRAVVAGEPVRGPGPVVDGGEAFDQMTTAERRVVVELARRPDTRARLARRLHLSISTVDSHLRAIKQKVGDELARAGQLPADGVVSTEALIGWAIEHGFDRMPAADGATV